MENIKLNGFKFSMSEKIQDFLQLFQNNRNFISVLFVGALLVNLQILSGSFDVGLFVNYKYKPAALALTIARASARILSFVRRESRSGCRYVFGNLSLSKVDRPK